MCGGPLEITSIASRLCRVGSLRALARCSQMRLLAAQRIVWCGFGGRAFGERCEHGQPGPTGIATHLEALQADDVADGAYQLPGATGWIHWPALCGTFARHGKRSASQLTASSNPTLKTVEGEPPERP
jgi:hypothetical protein